MLGVGLSAGYEQDKSTDARDGPRKRRELGRSCERKRTVRDGVVVFYRGIGVCLVQGFIV